MIKTLSLTPDQYDIIVNKKTEKPFTGKFDHYSPDTIGTYLCRQCGLALFRSNSKFTSSCGWPSFDNEIENNITKIKDKDRIRTEIICSRCQGHLGHIFHGENYTIRNTRYCVNSASLDFIENNTEILDTQEAIIAAGCFWGVQSLFNQYTGVLFTEVGYIGDTILNPTYDLVCSGNTKFQESVRILFDPNIISYSDIIKYFFEIHNFSQTNGQGPDMGDQYSSKIFYYNNDQKILCYNIIKQLEAKQYTVATTLQPASSFWPAEIYHQDYYKKNKTTPYCHIKKKIFDV